MCSGSPYELQPTRDSPCSDSNKWYWVSSSASASVTVASNWIQFFPGEKLSRSRLMPDSTSHLMVVPLVSGDGANVSATFWRVQCFP